MFQICLFSLLTIFSLCCMHSSLSADSILYDPEIDKTSKQLRKEARLRALGSVISVPKPTKSIVEIDFCTETKMIDNNYNACLAVV